MKRTSNHSARSTATPRTAVSAGGVVFRSARRGVEVVLVGRRAERLWALPKGTPDGDESLVETAVREVTEETGLEVRMIAELGTVHYRFSDRDGRPVDKTVYHYLFEPTGGDLDRHDGEFDIVRWLDIHEAERLLTHRNQLHILHRAAERIAELQA